MANLCLDMVWKIIHKQALRSNTKSKKKSFQDFIENLIEDFPCSKCKPHFKKMYEEIPLNTFDGNLYLGLDISYFYWSVHIHNLVNLRLNKPMLSFEEAYSIHINDECEECELKNSKTSIAK
jgi:hypothetical protein